MSATPTAARPTTQTGGHWYYPDGRTAYEMPKKDGSGMRKTTLADARKLGLYPSVTTILKILHKEALVNWLCEQTALAVLTTPRLADEADDAFVYRVLHTERQQDQEAQVARDKGTDIHSAIEAHFTGNPVPPEMEQYVRPAINALIEFGGLPSSEVILIGSGYAGRTDLVQDCDDCWRIWDFKSAKNLPEKGAWSDHKLQLSAYAQAWVEKLVKGREMIKPIVTGNVYISTVKPGQFVICEHKEHWQETFEKGFRPLLWHWMWANDYWPVQP